MPFSESKDRQKVTYRNKKGTSKTTYKVNRSDTNAWDQASHAVNHFGSGGGWGSYSPLPDRTFGLRRSEGRPRPLQGAKADDIGFSRHNGKLPKKAKAYRLSPKERTSERRVNTAAGGIAGGMTGAFTGAAAGGTGKAAAAGAGIGALGGAAVGAAWRPNTHKLVGEKKVKKNLGVSAFGIEH